MVRTEYKTISNLPEEFDNMLNAHIVEGWQLVSFHTATNTIDGLGMFLFVALLRRDVFSDSENDRITTLRRSRV